MTGTIEVPIESTLVGTQIAGLVDAEWVSQWNDAETDDQCPADNETCLYIRNTGSSSHTLTIHAVGTCDEGFGTPIHDIGPITLAAKDVASGDPFEILIGPLRKYMDGDPADSYLATLVWSATPTGVKWLALKKG